ncbi:hypothetical protein CVT25_004224 [Psilocybe cyanescens]|uniref:Protein kinase domain-containing protein n=1 Tax=Psilocybe cyanescens TaxID=93625 RepID=A0A409X300_PSICY|nr:hypothetical protein CVT25_004224 [Psilocybe cyanescens]
MQGNARIKRSLNAPNKQLDDNVFERFRVANFLPPAHFLILAAMAKLIPFDPGDRQVDRIELFKFWESMRGWFIGRGYHLYEFVAEEGVEFAYAKSTIPYNPHPNMSVEKKIFDAGEDPFPYAYMGGDPTHLQITDRPVYSTHHTLSGRVMYAQDTKGRHVAIKLVKGGSEEDKILHLLKGRQPDVLKRDTFNFVIPILDLIPCDDHWFAVMPRWDSTIHSPFYPTLYSAIQHIRSLLKGLIFLHENRIYHRDLRTRNLLVDHFSNAPMLSMFCNLFRRALMKRGDLTCAITDFDFSILLDEKTYGPNPRLPILGADVGYEYPPYETMHGHVDYDPFKYDVALLGIYFCDTFQRIITDVPLLAPLIDRMVMSNPDERFTAKEALAFADSIVPTVYPEARIDLGPEGSIYYCFVDIWEGLPPDFVAKWAHYREDRQTLSFRILNYLFANTRKHQEKTASHGAIATVLKIVSEKRILPKPVPKHILQSAQNRVFWPSLIDYRSKIIYSDDRRSVRIASFNFVWGI